MSNTNPISFTGPPMTIESFFMPITHGGVKWSYACITYLTTILICPFLIALIDYYNLHILDPLFLVCTFLHEFSHALATWATCGKVSKIHVDANRGGWCQSAGGIQAIILPAGYIGSCFWGCLCIVCSSSTTANTCLLFFFIILLGIVIPCYADGMLTKILGVMMLVFCIIFVVIAFKAPQYLFLNMMFVLVFGTLNSLYAIRDIIDDNIKDRPDGHGSDAAVMARLNIGGPCSSKVCWGVIFVIVSICIWIVAIICGWCVCFHYGMLFPGEKSGATRYRRQDIN